MIENLNDQMHAVRAENYNRFALQVSVIATPGLVKISPIEKYEKLRQEFDIDDEVFGIEFEPVLKYLVDHCLVAHSK